MKNKILIIRYGEPQPLPKEVELMHKIGDSTTHLSMFIPLGRVGLISFVYTDWEPARIAQEFNQLGKLTDDTLPVVVGEIDKLGIHLEDLPGFNECLGEFIKSVEDFIPSQNEVDLNVDQILDLANEVGGFENLSEESKILIKKFTKKA